VGTHDADEVIDLAEYRRRREDGADAAVLALFARVTGKPMHLVNRTPEELEERRKRALRRRAERSQRIRMQIENGVLVYQDDDPDGMIGV